MVLKLELYSRPGCHLCEVMAAELKTILKDASCRLEVINIDSEPRLQRLYAARIPVLICDDQVLSEFHLDRESISELLISQVRPCSKD